MQAILLAVLFTALRWALVVGVMTIFWNFHTELTVWGYAKVMDFLATLGLPSIALPDLSAWLSANHLSALPSIINEWLPLSELLGAVVAYFTFYVAITPMKMLLRRIPGING